MSDIQDSRKDIESSNLKRELVSQMKLAEPFWSNQQEEQGPDLIKYILKLRQRWKLILLVVVIGASLSIVRAITIPKTYKSSVQLSLPSSDSVSKFATNGVENTSKIDLFKEYFNLIRSEKFLRSFLDEKGYLKKLYPKNYEEDKKGLLFSRFARKFTIKIDEPILPKGKFVDKPTRVSIYAEHQDEALLTELLNEYVKYANFELFKIKTEQQKKQRQVEVSKLQRELSLMREDALRVRQMAIRKKEAENALKIEELQQQIETLLFQGKAGIETQIVVAEEAARIAKAMGIVNPTQLQDLKGSRDDVQTSINLSNDQSLPLYLMGTKYLDIFIDTLKKRQGDERFDSKISQIRSDIQVVKNDKLLLALKNRESDDPYIEGLTDILNKISSLKQLSLDFSEVLAYSQDKDAFLSFVVVSPNRPLIVIIGTLLSALLIIIYVLLDSAVKNREKSQRKDG